MKSTKGRKKLLSKMILLYLNVKKNEENMLKEKKE